MKKDIWFIYNDAYGIRIHYINYRKEKSKRYLIESCFHGFCIVYFLFYYMIK